MDLELKEQILKEMEGKMKSTLEVLDTNLKTIRVGRANAQILEPITVKTANGTNAKIKELASIATPDPQTLALTVWDPLNVEPIEKALRESKLNFNPVVAKPLIRIPIPFMSGERRQELAKQAKKYAEDCKVVLRGLRKKCHDDLKNLQKQKKLSEDMLKVVMDKQVQKVTDRMTDEAEKKLEAKTKEILL